MEEELENLKKDLRSLVVSSATPVTVQMLINDYKKMIGSNLPVGKFGYRNVLDLLKDKFTDSFVFEDDSSNPILTLIVPDTLKHINKFVSRQKLAGKYKYLGRRRSVQVPQVSSSLPVATRAWASPTACPALPVATRTWAPPTTPVSSRTWTPPTARPTTPVSTYTPAPSISRSATPVTTRTPELPISRSATPAVPRTPATPIPRLVKPVDIRTPETLISGSATPVAPPTPVRPISRSATPIATRTPAPPTTSPTSPVATHISCTYSRRHSVDKQKASTTSTASTESSRESPLSAMQRLSLLSAALQDEDVSLTSSSLDSGERDQDPLNQIGEKLAQLLKAHPDGIWCMELMGLYQEAYGRKLHYERWSCSVIGLVRRLADVVRVERFHPTGDWFLSHVDSPPPRPVPFIQPETRSSTHELWDPEDALPYVPYEEGVFPRDCMGLGDSIPELQLPLRRGDTLDLQVTELYSPSHLWVMPLGPDHSAAVDAIMEDMTLYYESEEGSSRWLAAGAAQVGHYCAGRYGWQWHRCLIVQRIDSDTVKVRHVDYGTVDKVAIQELRPLLKRWDHLPAQALRGRMCGVRPCGSATRWPQPARVALLHLVSNRSLVGVVLATGPHRALALYLVDTATEVDVYLHDTLVERGHADPAPDPTDPAAAPAAPTADWYERYPSFEALESGDTLNFAELQEVSRLGMEPDFLPRYRAHVPPLAWVRSLPPPHLRRQCPPPGFEHVARPH